MEAESTLKRRYETLRRGVQAIRGVKLTGESPRLAAVQGYLARGDRRVSRVLLAALANGGNYPAAVRETGVDVGRYLYAARGKDEVLPWDMLDLGVSRDYLWADYEKGLKVKRSKGQKVGSSRSARVSCPRISPGSKVSSPPTSN